MTVKKWHVLILLPWISLPIVLAGYAVFWSRLPERLAVHFDFSGAANGWMSRNQSVVVNIAILLFVLANFTFKLWGRESGDSMKTMVAYYAAVIIIAGVFLAILKYNV